MKFDNYSLTIAYKHTWYNKEEVLQSKLCGCIYCLNMFKPSEITEWLDNDDPNGTSAMCPYCENDTVIGDKSGFPINKKFLSVLHEHTYPGMS